MVFTIIFNFIALLSLSLAIYAFLLAIPMSLLFLLRKKLVWNEEEKASYRIGMIAALPIGISAVVLGFLSGLSFEPSVSALVTGVISLISGSAVYLFAKERETFVPISLSILVFSLNLLGGATLGSETRDRALIKAEVEARDRLLIDAINTSVIEFKVLNFRKNLGLDTDIKHLGIMNPPQRIQSPSASGEREQKAAEHK